MNIVLGLLGMAAGIAIIRYRETIGDILGDASWTRYIGGPYNFAILIGVLLFFFSLAKMTGTTGFFLAPIQWLLPSPAAPPPTQTGF
jgi:hypothetical protein